MTAVFTTPERVPANAVQRLLGDLTNALAALDLVLEKADPSHSAAVRLQRARTLLAGEAASLEAEATRFQAGERDPLLRHASELVLLAQRMDGYDFVSSESDKFTAQRQRLVLTAWQIAACASGSEAAGL